jgi:hypothetical protein
MRYALLIYTNETQDAQASQEEQGAMYAEYNAFGEQHKDSIRGGEALQPTSTATTVQVRKGKKLTTDGPFAETKEQLGGYYIVEAANLDEAISIAADIPGAKVGSIEVRPVMEFEGTM